MRPRHGWLRAITAGVVAAPAVSGTSAGVPGAAAGPGGPAAAEYGGVVPVGEITLVTGDVVAVGVEPDGRFGAEVTRPAAGPEDRTVLFSTVRERDSLYVYPSDAMGMVTAGPRAALTSTEWLLLPGSCLMSPVRLLLPDS